MKQSLATAALILGLVCFAVIPSRAGPPTAAGASKLAIEGYDPVAYFADNKPEKGNEKIQSVYKGRVYYFALAAHKATFDKDPAKYVPQFGGYCAYGVSQGHKVTADPTQFLIVDGRLLLQHSGEACDAFKHDPNSSLEKAD